MASLLKGALSLADTLAQATGRQLNRIGSKLGMDKDMLNGLSDNQKKTAILDEHQKYLRENKKKNTNRRVGAAAAAGAAASPVAQFVHDTLGISSVGDGTLKADDKPLKSNVVKSKTDPKKDGRVNPKDYPTYQGKTKSAEAFRKAFAEAKKDKKKTFKFEGRSYKVETK